MDRKRLHYLIPGTAAFCKNGCKLGYAILTPMEDGKKYTLKFNCGHAIPNNVKTVIKKYYSRMIGNAKEYRQACIERLEQQNSRMKK